MYKKWKHHISTSYSVLVEGRIRFYKFVFNSKGINRAGITHLHLIMWRLLSTNDLRIEVFLLCVLGWEEIKIDNETRLFFHPRTNNSLRTLFHSWFTEREWNIFLQISGFYIAPWVLYSILTTHYNRFWYNVKRLSIILIFQNFLIIYLIRDSIVNDWLHYLEYDQEHHKKVEEDHVIGLKALLDLTGCSRCRYLIHPLQRKNHPGPVRSRQA